MIKIVRPYKRLCFAAEVNGEPMFIFNLSSVVPGEKLLSAEIHLFKRKPKKQWHKKRDLELLMYEIAPHYMSENGKITMRAESYGWQWYDVTDSALSCLAARRDTPHLFALNFQVEKQNGKVKTIAIKKFIRRHSMPFLIIYSNDTQNIHLDQLDSLAEKLNKEKLQDKHISNKLSSESPVSRDSAKQVESRTLELENSSDKKNIKTVMTRRRRSIFNNEIPEDPADYTGFGKRFNIPQTHPGILQTRRESRHKLTDPRLIPYPDNTDGRPNRRKNRKNRKNRRRKNKNRKKNKNKLVFPKEWNAFHENQATAENSGNLCGKRKLILDFADIGWEDWIIAPKSFEAHYCAGSCPFPLTKVIMSSLFSFVFQNYFLKKPTNIKSFIQYNGSPLKFHHFSNKLNAINLPQSTSN